MKIRANIWNNSHCLDLTAAQAIANASREEQRGGKNHRDLLPAKPKAKTEAKATVYKLAWVAPEFR